jgi:hypothetical protein
MRNDIVNLLNCLHKLTFTVLLLLVSSIKYTALHYCYSEYLLVRINEIYYIISEFMIL